jgi:hypothetical protein
MRVIPSQDATSLQTKPAEPVYSALPSHLPPVWPVHLLQSTYSPTLRPELESHPFLHPLPPITHHLRHAVGAGLGHQVRPVFQDRCHSCVVTAPYGKMQWLKTCLIPAIHQPDACSDRVQRVWSFCIKNVIGVLALEKVTQGREMVEAHATRPADWLDSKLAGLKIVNENEKTVMNVCRTFKGGGETCTSTR